MEATAPDDERPDPFAALNIREYAAELRTIRRENDLPSARWVAPAVQRALQEAVEAGYDPEIMLDAMRVCAADRTTNQPGRLKAAGPWWDAGEIADMTARRNAAAEAARAAIDACSQCGPDGLVEVHDGVRRCDHRDRTAVSA